MANPQTENGFIQMATGDSSNDVFAALFGACLSGAEYQCASVVIRKTWGFKKNEDWISLTQFQKLTNRARITVIESINSLVRKNILVRKSIPGVKTLYGFNKKFSEWKLTSMEKHTSTSMEKHTSTEKHTPLVRKSVPTKETITKERKENREKVLLCTEQQLWEIAVKLHVAQRDVNETYESMLRSIEDGDKYKVKNAPLTVLKWVQRGIRMGDIEPISDLEYMGLLKDTPEYLRERAKLVKQLQEQEEREYAERHKQG
jgi:phage replication O-like protein O